MKQEMYYGRHFLALRN
ncbi:hypothetical protein JZO86_16530 [Enterococcus ureasiticus]|nr:hypothetical protein [Enterococcus sp. DIV0849a]MBO0475290.1 hypothetical protein [Enterococcus ureasiticus]